MATSGMSACWFFKLFHLKMAARESAGVVKLVSADGFGLMDSDSLA